MVEVTNGNNWDERLDRYSMRNHLGNTQHTHKKYDPESVTYDQSFNLNMADLLIFIQGQPNNHDLEDIYKSHDIPYIEHEGKLISSGAILELSGLLCDTKIKELVVNKLRENNIPITHVLTLLKKALQTNSPKLS
jgi:hypothetical protein